MSLKLVIFDLDNTLVLTHPAAKEGYKQAIYFIAKKHGLYQSRDKLYNHWKRIVHQLRLEPKPYKRRFAYSLGLLLDEHHLPWTYLQPALGLYEAVMLKHLKTMKGAKELLSSCREQGLRVAIATGSDTKEAVKKLKAASLYSYCDYLITANEVGSMKPHPKYYRLALSHFQVSPSQAVVIGDHQAEDIAPALKLGITAYRVTPQTHLMAYKTLLVG